MYALYSFLLTAAAILGAPYWLFKGLREKKYLQSFRQRLGSKGPALPLGTRPVWVHAVSVGEVLAARPVVAAIQQVRPELPVVLSTVTPAGQALALKEFPAAAAVFYFPFDWHFCVARFLSSVNPRAVLLVEKELWPNFLDACFRRGVPVFLVKGRISEHSFNRYRRIKSFTAGMLRQLRLSVPLRGGKERCAGKNSLQPCRFRGYSRRRCRQQHERRGVSFHRGFPPGARSHP
ncbi:MAG: hypothetical protein DMG10_30670 [Acidobacteria bacterium]|nr:MAG: hypothetical protein DMG10_30670 [Acidobacteriota bacterium]